MIAIRTVNIAKNSGSRCFLARRKRFVIALDSNNCQGCLCAVCG